MSNSIKLSKKHGVNPTIPVCFFCGEPKNEIALLGKIGGRNEDLEAPKHCVLDYEPCEKCAEKMKQGVALIEVSDIQPSDGRPPMKAQGQQLVYPLGRYIVIKSSAWSEMTSREFKDGDKCFVDTETLDMLLGGAK